MLDLYEWPPTRSQRARWALEELGLDYGRRPVNLTEGAQNDAAYRALHPLGGVPALRTDDYVMFESVAIVLQLIDEQPDKDLAPAIGTPQRGHEAAVAHQDVGAGKAGCQKIIAVGQNVRQHRGALGELLLSQRCNRSVLACLRRPQVFGRPQRVVEIEHQRRIELGAGEDTPLVIKGALMGLIGGFPALEAYYDRLRQRPAHRRAYPESP